MHIDPTFLAPLSKALERAVNTLLKYDPATSQQLASLNGNSLVLVIEDCDYAAVIQLLETSCSVALLSADQIEDGEHSVILRGRAQDYLALLRKNTSSLAGSGVRANGNVSVLEKLQSVFSQLDIDWQDALYQHIGPVSLPIIQVLEKGSEYVQQTSRKQFTAAKEYIEHESIFTVNQAQFQVFCEDNNALRSAADRLEARIAQLTRKLSVI